MATEFADSRVFIRGAARYHDLVYILSKGKSLLEQDINHTSAICVDQGNWANASNTEWDSTAIAVAKKPAEKLVFIGEEGDVCTYVGGHSTREKITPSPRMIRNARSIEGYVYACGMQRQVYQRVDENFWKDMSAPFPNADEKVGFEALDGYSSKEIYTAGWGGEIWEFDGTVWNNRMSPTNLILTSICCAGDDVVYIGGQQGILIKGRGSSWEAVQWEDPVDADLWDLCWFQDKLYVATINSLYVLTGNKLEEVDFGGISVNSCYSLTQAEGVMWSIGSYEVISFDGITWQKYD
jgi:hypothetical protein